MFSFHLFFTNYFTVAKTPKIQNILGFTEVFVVFGVFHKQFKGIKSFYPFNFKND